MTKTTSDGISQAKFCSFSGKCCTKFGRICVKPATFKPSITPNNNAIAVTGPTTRDGTFQNFQKKLSMMTTIAGGYIAVNTGTDTVMSLVKPRFDISNEKATKINTNNL